MDTAIILGNCPIYLKKERHGNGVNEKATAFKEIKKQFLKTVMLIHPNPHIPYILETDSSDCGIGGVLYQVHDDGTHGVVAFQSRSLRGGELNCHKDRKGIVSYSLQFAQI